MSSDPTNETCAKNHVGYAAIVGRPNVGKSTLLNRLLGEKVAIVSKRPQTTRNRILGVRTWGEDQLVVLDTPGIHRSRANLNRFMVREALESIHGVDCILLMTEVERQKADPNAFDISGHDRYVLEQIELQGASAPIMVVINKIDKLGADRLVLLPLMSAWNERGFESIMPISALKGDGVDDLVKEVLERLPAGDLIYPEEMLTDRAERFLAAELIREQIFQRCYQEIPYSVGVTVDSFEERGEDVRIEAVIRVERSSQRSILIGSQGKMIKAVGIAARMAIGRLLGCKVHLMLKVLVDLDWSKTEPGRRKLGYQ